MCIRDRRWSAKAGTQNLKSNDRTAFPFGCTDSNGVDYYACLLYTSDAADERSSVDLGGRRIIKKTNKRDEVGNGVI